MAGSNLTWQARAYVWLVVLAGGAVGGAYLVHADMHGWDWRPIVLFGVLAVLGSVVSLTTQGYLPTRIVHQIGTSFVYALFFLADPAAVCLAIWLMALADGVINKRRALTTLFNIGQLTLALGAAVEVRSWIRPGFTRLQDVDPRTMAAAGASLAVFFFVNQALTQVVTNLASRRPLDRMTPVSQAAVFNEVLCGVSGLGMAVFWWIQPWLVFLGVVPIWILTVLLLILSRREQELEGRQAELRSLQDLGLEIGSELDVERLRSVVVRIAAEALHASAAVLGRTDEERETLRIESHHGLDSAPPERIPLPSAALCSLDHEGIVRLDGGVGPLRALETLAALLDRGEDDAGLLLLFHGASRRPFDEQDIRRLETLVRFVEVAFANARLLDNVREMQEQLIHTEKMSALGMLVSGVAHELNNPLTSVVGYTQLALGREQDPRSRRMLESVFSEAIRAGKIVQNLLTFSRKHKPEKKLVQVNEVLEQVIELRAYELRVNNIQVVRRLSPDLPTVLIDPFQFQQVFLNLLTNAEQAVRETGRKGKITVESRMHHGGVHIRIADNGPGITDDNLKKIFLPFFTTKPIGKGTGLGLSICYGIVEEHGGTITAGNNEKGGAFFTVVLPPARGRETEDREEDTPRETVERSGAAGRLLVVDDEESIASLVRDVLEPEGWRVETALDGSEALEIVGENDFDVLLVDLKMPGMDGQTFFSSLRRARPEMASRVIFASGDTENPGAARFLDEAGCPYLRKPYDVVTLMDTVSRMAR